MSITKESAITAGVAGESAPPICWAAPGARRGDAPLRPNAPLLATTTLSPKEAALRAADAAARPPPMTRTLQVSSAGLAAAMIPSHSLSRLEQTAVACRAGAVTLVV